RADGGAGGPHLGRGGGQADRGGGGRPLQRLGWPAGHPAAGCSGGKWQAARRGARGAAWGGLVWAVDLVDVVPQLLFGNAPPRNACFANPRTHGSVRETEFREQCVPKLCLGTRSWKATLQIPRSVLLLLVALQLRPVGLVLARAALVPQAVP